MKKLNDNAAVPACVMCLINVCACLRACVHACVCTCVLYLLRMSGLSLAGAKWKFTSPGDTDNNCKMKSAAKNKVQKEKFGW